MVRTLKDIKKARKEYESSLQGQIDNYVIKNNYTRSKNKNEEEWYKEILNLDRFKDVDSVGDFFETVGATAFDTVGNAWQGIFQGAEGLSDFARNRYADAVDTIAKGTDLVGWDSASKTLKGSAKEAREIAKQNETQEMVDAWEHIISGDLGMKKPIEEIKGYEKIQDKSIFGNVGREGVQSIALNLTTAGMNAASGGTLGLPLIAVSAAGNAEQEALKNNATIDEARTYGLLMGGIEAATETLAGGLGKVSEGLGFGKGALDDQLIKQLSKKMKNTALKNISTFAIKSIGEGGEEVLAGLGGAFAQKLTYMSEEDIKELIKNQDLMKSFIMGTLSSTIMQAPSTITSTAQGRDVNTGLTQVQQEYVNEIAQQRIAEAQKRNEKLNRYQQTKIEDRTLQDFQENRLFDKSKLPMSDNVKDMDLQQSAYKYGINPNSEAVVNIKALLDNRNIKGRFDEDLFKGSNENSLWSKKNGVRYVVFNPNTSADALLEELAIHELTHDLMSSENSQEIIDNQKIMDYVSTLDGYKEERAKVEKLYAEQTKKLKTKEEKAAYIDEEIVANTLGKNIGSQEYIRQLIDSQPSLSKVIYNWIVKTVNNLANKNGVKKEQLYWENIKNNFEKAYNMDWEGKGKKTNTKYSIGGYKAIEQLEDSKYKEHALKAYNKANQMQQSGKYTNEEIRKQTKWFKDKNGDWKFEISDSSMSLKESLEDIKPGKEYSVTELFDHKLLTELYPSLKDYKIVFENLDGTKKGSHNIEKKLIRINANMTDYKNLDSINKAIAKKLNMGNYEYAKTMIEGTLLHEIQHAIQEFENFETGKNAALFRKAYYESLGEIEANDTKMRYILERSGNLDRIKKAPESSKALPIHKDLLDKSNLDRYLNKRSETRKFLDNLYDKYPTQIDKIMEKAYNFLSKKGMSNEEIDSLVEKYEEEVVREDNRNILRRGATIEGTSDSSFFDTRYSLSVKEANTGKDNSGKKLSEGMKNYMQDSKTTDEKGNIIRVFHTTTDNGEQFNEFNPVGTDYYRFNEQVVNFYTDSKEMSGSYANQEYKMADTKTFKTIDDVNKWLAEKSAVLDKHYIKEVDGKYYLYNNNLPTKYSWDNIQTMFDEVRDKFYENPFYSVDNKPRKFQYEGYVNITNPYIVDAEGQMWDSVKSGIDPKIPEQLNRITAEEKKALTQLAKNSVEMHKTQWTKETEDEYYVYEHKFKDLTLDEQHQIIYHQLGMELDNPNKEIHIDGWVGSKYIDRYETLESFANKYNELSDYYNLYRDETSYFQSNFKNMLNTNKIENIRNTDLFDIAYQDFKEENYAGVFQKDFSTNDVVFEVLKKNQNGSNYDGVIIKNVVDYGGKSDTREPANLYITFASNQFKAIDNENPTEDADIRYSLSEKGTLVDNKGNEVTLKASDTGTHGTLIAIHNLSEAKMKGILELGGFPVPSIAITKVSNTGSNQFGNITVLFDKETINPADRRNEVYDRDVWTPTFPTVEYDVDNESLRKLIKDNNIYNDHQNDIASRVLTNYFDASNLAYIVNGYGIESALDRMKNDTRLMYLYQKTINPDYKDITKPTKYSSDYSNETLQKFIDNFKHDMELPDFYYHYLNYGDMKLTEQEELDLKQSVRDVILPEVIKEAEAEYDRVGYKSNTPKEKFINGYINLSMEAFDNSYFKYKDFVKNASRLYEFGETQSLDESETLKKVESETNKEEFHNWVENIVGEYLKTIKKGIRNDKDLFTPSGNRRSFNQLHENYDLANIVKYMTSKKTVAGEEGFGAGSGFGTIQAQMSTKFGSIDEIRQYANERIVPLTEEHDLMKPYSDTIYEDMENLVEYYRYKDSQYSYPMDNVGYALNDFAGYKTQNISNLKKALDNNGIIVDDVPNELLQKIVEDINALKNIPTDYFEAKPQRAVGLNEAQAVVIPNTASTEFKQQLQDAGLRYYEYDPNIEGDRQRVINQFEDLKFSQQNEGWQSFLDNNFKPKGTKTRLGDIKLPGLQNAIQEEVQTQTQQALLPITNELKKLNKNLNKVMNPTEIAQLTPQDANTTPNLPGVTRNKVGDGKSKYFDNVNNKVGMLNDEQKAAILSDEDVKYYDKVTNKDSLDKAFERLQENGANESLRWFNIKSENADATDVAEGWILLKQYADSGNTEGMVEVAKKMREIGTKAGQTIQAFNILSRLTPEGMVKYAQSELMEAYDIMVKNKSAKWIEENRSKFELKPEEVQFIMDTMKDVSTMEDGYDKKFKLAQIQKIMTDKLPPEKGAGMKAWMRISMLFNPKTQVRNVAGNAIIAPVNAFGDLFASAADKLISLKTGVRTTGNINLKNYAKGMGTGLYQSYNDFKHGVNTRNIEGNRFEISQGKSFKDTNPIGKALNKVDRLLSFMLDAGDRGFYEAAFTNSINNQLVLNNTIEVTQDMIDIATQEALSRTWQDNNKYTKFVMSIRNQLNQINVAGYGLGDVLIPFAKTPANLTKAIVDYSPAGLIGTINKGIQLKKSLTNGQYNAQMQHDFVQSLGKAVAGTMLYVAGIALANAGVTTGESDEDKDTANFLKNTLGINSYSIKIGDRTFTYDWAQPIAAPLAITANLVQKQKEEATLLENITSTLDTAGNLLLEQSFMESISTVLNNNEGIATGIQEAILDLPARAVPTLFKQIVDMTDSTQRQTFEKGKPLQSAINSVKAKIPGLSQTLSPSVDTLGRDIEKYGGKNNIFNVFINPANVNTENVSESAAEIYKVYKATGETSVMPRVAPYTITIDNKKINLSAADRTEYQRISGEIIENNVQNLISTIEYNNLPDKEKAEVIKNIVNYSYNIAQKEMYGKDLSDAYENAYEYSQIGDVSDYYTFKASIDDTNAQTKKISIKDYLVNSYLNDEQIAKLYGAYYSSESELSLMLNAKVPMKEYVKFNSEEFVSDYNNKGNAITNSRRNKMINYVNGLNLNQAQKVILIKTEYSSFNNYDNVVFNYINKLPDSAYNKMVMLKKVGFDEYDNQIIAQVNAQNISREEKIKKLKEMGFTIRNGRVYS